MNSDHPGIDAIFCKAIEIDDDAQRAAYVSAACAGDSKLQDRLMQLLASHFRAGSFLNEPASELESTMDRQAGVEQLGQSIGRYKLREQLGEGGFGVVWAAEQTEPVHRKVALKIIKPGMDTRDVVARFEAERQALAMMNHPNIARVAPRCVALHHKMVQPRCPQDERSPHPRLFEDRLRQELRPKLSLA